MMTDFLLKLSGNPWYLIGFGGQLLFMMRFVVQWWHSEKYKRSVVPVAFWFFSMGGGTVLFAYAISQKDPVFIVGQGLGLLIYMRNLYFICGQKQPPNKDRIKELKKLSHLLTEQVENEKELEDPSAILTTLSNIKALLK